MDERTRTQVVQNFDIVDDQFTDFKDTHFWTFLLTEKLNEYLPQIDEFWESYQKYDMNKPGVFPLNNGKLPGIQVRVCRTLKRSPIPGLQVFPYIPVQYLQIPVRAPGGLCKMMERICEGNRFTIDKYQVIERHNLPSLYNAGQVLILIPLSILDNLERVGAWIFMTPEEMQAIIAQDTTPRTLRDKLLLKL